MYTITYTEYLYITEFYAWIPYYVALGLCFLLVNANVGMNMKG